MVNLSSAVTNGDASWKVDSHSLITSTSVFLKSGRLASEGVSTSIGARGTLPKSLVTGFPSHLFHTSSLFPILIGFSQMRMRRLPYCPLQIPRQFAPAYSCRMPQLRHDRTNGSILTDGQAYQDSCHPYIQRLVNVSTSTTFTDFAIIPTERNRPIRSFLIQWRTSLMFRSLSGLLICVSRIRSTPRSGLIYRLEPVKRRAQHTLNEQMTTCTHHGTRPTDRSSWNLKSTLLHLGRQPDVPRTGQRIQVPRPEAPTAPACGTK